MATPRTKNLIRFLHNPRASAHRSHEPARTDEVETVFAAYLEHHDESTRLSAYELGRRALGEGVGLMPWIARVHGAIVAAVQAAPSPAERAATDAAGRDFLLECLSPFEMWFRGAREANDALRKHNDCLEQETRRIAHELHDCAGQILSAAYLEMHRLATTAPPDMASGVVNAIALLDQAHADLRRLSHELRPTILDDLGLVPALKALGEGLSQRSGLAVSIEGSTGGRLPAPVEIALYRTVQEALTNASKHARAAHAEIRVERGNREIRCVVTDDGVGLQEEIAPETSRGLGMLGLRERLAPLGGSIRWGSVPGAGGTMVAAVIPLEESHAPTNFGR